MAVRLRNRPLLGVLVMETCAAYCFPSRLIPRSGGKQGIPRPRIRHPSAGATSIKQS
jgi:hypothetical protein